MTDDDGQSAPLRAPMATYRALEKAKETLLAGGLVAMPTETVYGLAADATNDQAVARIFEAKGRPQFNPLIVHVTGAEMAKRYAKFSPLAERLAAEFWPGPLTLVLPRLPDANVSLLVSAGLDTLALRAPDSFIAQKLIEAVDRPLAAPSANASGTISPTSAAHVRQSLGEKVDFIIDGGACSVGVESTILKIEGDDAVLLRPGGLSRETIEAFIGRKLRSAKAGDKPQAPGMLASHYAPRARLRLNAGAPQPGEAFLGFGATAAAGPYALNLSEAGDLREAAANLFAYLRRLDDLCTEHELEGIAAAPVPQEGLGEAINDRLNRAAAPQT